MHESLRNKKDMVEGSHPTAFAVFAETGCAKNFYAIVVFDAGPWFDRKRIVAWLA